MRRSALHEEATLDRPIERVRLDRNLAALRSSDLRAIFAMVLAATSFCAGVFAAIFEHDTATAVCAILVMVFGLRASGATSVTTDAAPQRIRVKADYEVLSPPPARGRDAV